MFLMKEQDIAPEEEISEVEIANLLEKICRLVIVKMIKELGRRMAAHSKKLEVFNRELGNIKKN